jgi:GT2 family glycosyltransferase
VAEPQHPASGGSELRVTVVVPHYNDLPALGRCLDALQAQTLPADAFEIVVADNASPQGEAAVAAVIAGRARLLTVPERGAGPARNAGVGAARAPIIAFTDSDCVPEPEWLEQGLSALADGDLIGGRMTVLIDPTRPKTGAEAFEQVFAFKNERYIREENFTVSANLFCSREVFEGIGPFYPAISEDVEWGQRAVAKGYRLGYAPDAIVGHPARADWQDLLKKWRRRMLETHVMAGPELGKRLRWLSESYLLPASIVAHAPRILSSPKLHGSREKAAALATLVRLRLWRVLDAHRLFFGLRR